MRRRFFYTAILLSMVMIMQSCSKNEETAQDTITVEFSIGVMTDGILSDYYHPVLSYTVNANGSTKTKTVDMQDESVDLKNLATPCNINFSLTFEKQAGAELDADATYAYTGSINYFIKVYTNGSQTDETKRTISVSTFDKKGSEVADFFSSKSSEHSYDVAAGGAVYENK